MRKSHSTHADVSHTFMAKAKCQEEAQDSTELNYSYYKKPSGVQSLVSYK